MTLFLAQTSASTCPSPLSKHQQAHAPLPVQTSVSIWPSSLPRHQQAHAPLPWYTLLHQVLTPVHMSVNTCMLSHMTHALTLCGSSTCPDIFDDPLSWHSLLLRQSVPHAQISLMTLSPDTVSYFARVFHLPRCQSAHDPLVWHYKNKQFQLSFIQLGAISKIGK